jgi:hypothetical protein
MQLRCTFFYEQRKYGWTETLYRNDADQNAAIPHMEKLLTARLQYMTSDSFGVFLRACNVDSPRDAMIKPLTGKSGQGSAPTDFGSLAFNAVLVRMFSTPVYWRPMFIRGITHGLVHVNEAGIDPVIQLPNPWVNLLINDGWQIKVKKKDAPNQGTTIYVGINKVFGIRLTHRNTGRPFDSPRGLRPVR